VASSRVILRPYQSSDFENLYRIDKACFPKGIAYGKTEMKAYLCSEGSYCLVAEDSKDVAGFILTERSTEQAHIITLDVLETYRRQKIGSLLLESAEQEAVSQGVQRIYLETATTNKAAIALWKKHGYREIAVATNYYGRGLDAFRMRKLILPRTGAGSTWSPPEPGTGSA
jgi:ribosomal-protein-alanine N-acetyltransferase